MQIFGMDVLTDPTLAEGEIRFYESLDQVWLNPDPQYVTVWVDLTQTED